MFKIGSHIHAFAPWVSTLMRLWLQLFHAQKNGKMELYKPRDKTLIHSQTLTQILDHLTTFGLTNNY